MALRVELGGHTMEFDTAAGLFSPAHADRGTLAMLACADLAPGQRVLDLGCGWGLAGVYAALVCGAENVVMTDVDPRAAALARKNARKNGVEGARVYVGDALEAVPDRAFDRILLNPPYQTDFAVAKRLILKSFNRLEIGGGCIWWSSATTGTSTSSKACSAARARTSRTATSCSRRSGESADMHKNKLFVIFVWTGFRFLCLTAPRRGSTIDK